MDQYVPLRLAEHMDVRGNTRPDDATWTIAVVGRLIRPRLVRYHRHRAVPAMVAACNARGGCRAATCSLSWRGILHWPLSLGGDGGRSGP